jgi:hypothetical protein
MSPPSGTRDEYSRKDGASGRVSGRGRAAIALSGGPVSNRGRRPAGRSARSLRLAFPRGLRPAVFLVAVLGAVLLFTAEFTSLYAVHVVGRSAPIETIAGGTNNSYAMVPIALLAAGLGLAAIGAGGRLALVALAAVGVVALLISLLGDLPGAQKSGQLVRFGGKNLLGSSSPSVGMYMETLGGVLLIVAAGLGLLFGEPAAAPREGAAAPPEPAAEVPGQTAAPAPREPAAPAPRESAAPAPREP